MVKSTEIGKNSTEMAITFDSDTQYYNKNYIFRKLSSLPFDGYIICLVSRRSEFSRCF